MLITQNGYRIYITFETRLEEEPDEQEMLKEGVVFDLVTNERFTHRWQISEIMYFPHDDLVEN